MQIKYLSFVLVAVAYVTLLNASVYAQDQKVIRFKIIDVEFEGNNAYSDRRLERIMLSKSSKLFTPRYYHEPILYDDLRLIEIFYHRNGYLQAVVLNSEVSIDSTKQKAYISITIDEGERTYINEISVSGLHHFSDEAINKSLKIKSEGPLVQDRVDQSVSLMAVQYAEEGFLDASVKSMVRIDSLNFKADVEFHIDENDQFVYGSTQVNGLTNTRERIVLRELNFREGEVTKMSTILFSQRKLYQTGLFKSVFVKLDNAEDASIPTKNIHLDIVEVPAREFTSSIGFGSYDKLRTRVGFQNNNLYGSAHKFGVAGGISFVSRSLETTYTLPWTFGIPWKTDMALRTEYQKDPNFELTKTGGRVQFSKVLGRYLTISMGYRFDNISYSESLLESPVSYIRSTQVVFSNDTRDDMFNPKKGYAFDLSGEMVGGILGGTDTFDKVALSTKLFYPATSRTVLGTAFMVGVLFSDNVIDDITPMERFYTGGPNVLRGFRYQSVGPRDANDNVIGGSLMLNLNIIEVRQDIYKMLGAVVFLDAGQVWYSPNRFDLSELRYSPGSGIRINTPIGLARFDVGWNFDSRGEEKDFQLFFNIGHSF